MVALSSCGDTCGLFFAILAVLAWGSFGAPIRSVSRVEVHPLVMQSFKTLVCFLTCWLVVFLGEEIRFSYYGIVSGLFWVPGATCGIYGIRNAGLAVSVGTWSSINVLVSFLFGIFIFQERVKSIVSVAFAFLTLIVGLIGMSRFSSEQRKMILEKKTKVPSKNAPQLESSERLGMSERGIMAVTGLSSMEIEPLIDDEDIIMGEEKDPSAQRFFFFGGRLVLTRRQTGIVGAVLNGVWGGLNLVPLHYAMQYDGLSGAGYLISYATGAFIVNVLLWVFLFVYILHQKRGSLKDTLDALPKWHLDQLLGPGLLAGLLYSIGNFSAMISVAILGQAVGFAFCQMQLFVSGLWGVFVFKEIKGTVLPWFLSAGVAVIGIIWLSYEHESVVIQE